MDGLLATLMNSIFIPLVYKPLEHVSERGPNYQILTRAWSWAWPVAGWSMVPGICKMSRYPHILYYSNQLDKTEKWKILVN